MTDDPSDTLRTRLRATYILLAENISARLGFGPLSEMPPGLRERLMNEVGQAVSDWQTAQLAAPHLVPKTDLQHLLAELTNLSRLLQERPGERPWDIP